MFVKIQIISIDTNNTIRSIVLVLYRNSCLSNYDETMLLHIRQYIYV